VTEHDAGLDRKESDAVQVVDLHEPIYRELAEPEDGYEPPPTWLLFLCLGLMGFGGWYLGEFSASFDPAVYDERARGARAVAVSTEAAALDPMVLGKRVYNNCMACHQRDGAGVPGNYPPLAGSSWVTGRADVLANILLHGLEGPIEVLGESYNQVMPGWDRLDDEQIAAVMTYVRGSFGNDAGPVSAELVATVRERGAERREPWTVAELEGYADAYDPPAAVAQDGAADASDAEG
jgi:mono/diheme cytochrome c family protein